MRRRLLALTPFSTETLMLRAILSKKHLKAIIKVLKK
jgi:hypothetical protein